jgi:type I restriction enzyme, S subunit
MPGDWTESTLGQVVDFISGGTPSKDEPSFWGGSVPWVSAKDMKQFLLHDAEDHLTEEGAKQATRVSPEGTVLLLTRGMTLLTDVPICVIRRPMAFNQDVKALRPRTGIRGEYLPYLLLGLKPRLLNLVDLAGHGTGRLNLDELKSLEIVLPPEDEQIAIASIFGTLDERIELNQRLSDTLEEVARAVFNWWFVDFGPVHSRIEGFDPGISRAFADLFPDSCQESERGEIPTGWEVRGLDEIGRFLNGLALQRFPPQDGRSLPVIKIAQLRAGNTEGADTASAELDSDYIVEDGDVLFSWSGSLECVLWSGGRGALNQHLFKVTSKKYPKWLYYLWIKHYLAEFRQIAAAKATTMGHIQRHHISEAKVVLPDAGLLEAADRLIGPLIEAIPVLGVQSRMLGLLRDSLLPKLIWGKVRIQDVNGIVGVHQ